MRNESQSVAEFFDGIAKEYSHRYGDADSFHSYFFNERLAEAIGLRPLGSRTVLDIGAGTGQLYDRLISLEPELDYYAIDIAEGMLNESRIPPDRRFVGEFGKVKLPVKQFDLIFLLGVTTYIDDIALRRLMEAIRSSLADDGRVVVTFTNRLSADWTMRRLFRLLPRSLFGRNYVLTQDFNIYTRSLGDVRKLIKGLFADEELRWLNHTIFPFNRIFKSGSVKAAKWLHGRVSRKSGGGVLSSDLLLVLRKDQPL